MSIHIAYGLGEADGERTPPLPFSLNRAEAQWPGIAKGVGIESGLPPVWLTPDL